MLIELQCFQAFFYIFSDHRFNCSDSSLCVISKSLKEFVPLIKKNKKPKHQCPLLYVKNTVRDPVGNLEKKNIHNSALRALGGKSKKNEYIK